MKKTYVCLALGLFLLLFLAVPVALSAEMTVYVDTTNSLTRDPNQTEGSQVNPATSWARGMQLMAGQSGKIVYIWNAGAGVQYCEYIIAGGNWTGQFGTCKMGIPPGTGEPVAPILWWILGVAGAVAMVFAGLVLRKRALPAQPAG